MASTINNNDCTHHGFLVRAPLAELINGTINGALNIGLAGVVNAKVVLMVCNETAANLNDPNGQLCSELYKMKREM